MQVTHTTLARNLKSILQYGLLATYARQGRKAVWFHTALKNAWAETHVKMRHDAENDQIVHLVVDVPRAWLTRHANGIWYCYKDVPPERIKFVRMVRTTLEDVDFCVRRV